MTRSPDSQRVLTCFEADDCLPAPIVNAFFEALIDEVELHPLPAGGSLLELGGWAYRRVLDTFDASAGAWHSKGPQLPTGRFLNLAHVRPARGYKWCLPADEREAFLEALPADESRWQNAGGKELRSWIEPHLLAYAGPYDLNSRSGFVWVTDANSFGATALSYAELKDSLGLDHEGEELGLLVQYLRVEVASLHLPRSFDGFNHPPFRLQPSCTAPHGMTLRLSTDTSCRPEAVHPGCQIGGGTAMLQLVA